MPFCTALVRMIRRLQSETCAFRIMVYHETTNRLYPLPGVIAP